MTLMPRDLPKLVTTTSTSTTPTTNPQSSTRATSTSLSNTAATTSSPGSSHAFPSLSTSSSTSTLLTSSITPPSAKDNPFIINNGKNVNGTVFIIVGSVLGAVFAILSLWWGITTYLSYRTAHRQSILTEKYNAPYNIQKVVSNDSDYSVEIDTEKGLEKPSNKASPIVSQESKELLKRSSFLSGFYDSFEDSVLDTPISNNNVRNSLFVSPTELIQMQRHVPMSFPHFDESAISVISSMSNTKSNSNNKIDVKLQKPEKAITPERLKRNSGISQHSEYNSNNNSGNVTPPITRPVSMNPRRKFTPSMYLDSLGENDV